MPASEYSLPERLRWAIKHHLPHDGRRRGTRHFVRLMEERASEAAEAGDPFSGASLTSIQAYLNGTVEPSRRFIREAAAVLGVRAAWLDYGELPITEEELSSTDTDAAPAAGHPMLDAAAAHYGLDATTRTLLGAATRRYAAGCREQSTDPHFEERLGLELLTLLDLPRELWGFNHHMSKRQLNDYAVAMLNALMMAMPDAGNGDLLEERGTLYGSGYELVIDRDAGVALSTSRLRAAKASLERLEARKARFDELAEAAQNAMDAGQVEEAEQMMRELQDMTLTGED